MACRALAIIVAQMFSKERILLRQVYWKGGKRVREVKKQGEEPRIEAGLTVDPRFYRRFYRRMGKAAG